MADTKRQQKLWHRFLKVFGDLKVFPHPMFLVYEPEGYAVHGEEVRALLQVVRRGDILVRGYRNYLDGYFIPGFFTHVGIYVGDVEESERLGLPSHALGAFRPGRQRVVHSMADGVFMEDLLHFARCDSLVVLRLPPVLTPRSSGDAVAPQWRFDPDRLEPEEQKVFRALRDGTAVDREEAVEVVRRRALACLGMPYDFDFDFHDHGALSCTELVQYAMRSLAPFHGLSPEPKPVLGFVPRTILEPDRFVASGAFEHVFAAGRIPEDVQVDVSPPATSSGARPLPGIPG